MKKLILTIGLVLGLAAVSYADMVEFYSDRVVVNPDESSGGYVYIIPGSMPYARIIVYTPTDEEHTQLKSEWSIWTSKGKLVSGFGGNMVEFTGSHANIDRGYLDGACQICGVQITTKFLGFGKNSFTFRINGESNENLEDFSARVDQFLTSNGFGHFVKKTSYTLYQITP